MAQCPQHTFQVLTKRADEMLDLLSHADAAYGPFDQWPLPNVWCGVSVEDQQRADERIPLLLRTPAAVRFLSVEPMLEAVRLDECAPYVLNGNESNPGVLNAFNATCHHPATFMYAPEALGNANGISWVICGGESGPGARPFNLAWAESLQKQCKAAGVPFFMKQLGSYPGTGPMDELKLVLTENSKGGDPAEWPEALRVRKFPLTRTRGLTV
jgi:protein gp37